MLGRPFGLGLSGPAIFLFDLASLTTNSLGIFFDKDDHMEIEKTGNQA